MPAPWGLLPGAGTCPSPRGDRFALLPAPGPATSSSANADADAGPRRRLRPILSVALSHRTTPERRLTSASTDTADLQRLEDAVADCTEAIRLDPDDPGFISRAPTLALCWAATQRPSPSLARTRPRHSRTDHQAGREPPRPAASSLLISVRTAVDCARVGLIGED